MGKKIIIHIGAHKTGTTSIQQFFADNSKGLEGFGILYPESCRYHFAQHRLAFALRQMRDPAKKDVPDLAVECRAIAEEIARSDCPTIFISSEEFFSLPKSSILPLREALKDHDVQVLAVLRRPDELFASLYNQMVKEPKNRFMRRHVAFIDEPSKLSLDLHFDAVLQNWSDVFGSAAVIARCFEQYPDSIALVAAVVGFDHQKLSEYHPRANVSVSIRTAEMIRMAKHAGFTEQQLRRLFTVGSKVFSEGAKEDSLLSPQERLQLLRNADAMTDMVFHKYVRGDNIYASRNFKESDFGPRTVLANMDFIRVIAKLIPLNAGEH